MPIRKKQKMALISDFWGKEANCHISKQLVIDGCVDKIHPIYNMYAASKRWSDNSY